VLFLIVFVLKYFWFEIVPHSSKVQKSVTFLSGGNQYMIPEVHSLRNALNLRLYGDCAVRVWSVQECKDEP
jgi:hypothetical protein